MSELAQEQAMIEEISSLIQPEKAEEEPEQEVEAVEPTEQDPEAVSDDEAVEAEETSDETPDDDVWSMRNLAEEAGIDIEELYSTPINFGEGRESTTLGEMKDAYDANRGGAKALQDRLSALDKLAVEGKAARAAVNEYEPQVNAAKSKLTELEGAWNAVDWEHIPEGQQEQYREYATNLQDGYKMAKLSLDNAEARMSDSTSQLAQMQAVEVQARQEAWQQQATEEWPKIVADNPSWTDKTAAEAGMNDLYGAFVEAGYSEEEAHQVTDSRLFRIAADALAYRKAGKIDLKEVKTKRRNVASKSPLPKSVRQRRAEKKAMEAAKSGSDNDKVAAISKLIS